MNLYCLCAHITYLYFFDIVELCVRDYTLYNSITKLQTFIYQGLSNIWSSVCSCVDALEVFAE